ncbi:hypothetical protein DERF_007870 [Dermatophagoides farinae]|uniref:Uncharacterized protein n=1 Tax=Dermatophagoides farinae TaxID=6954 RepID=A0A922L435_DERFA|nr:hypothetical protein DERF_007870 [Dermatophagoides farinae]
MVLQQLTNYGSLAIHNLTACFDDGKYSHQSSFGKNNCKYDEMECVKEEEKNLFSFSNYKPLYMKLN